MPVGTVKNVPHPRRALKHECKTAAGNVAIANRNHQVAQQNAKLSAAEGKPIPWLFWKRSLVTPEICLEDGSESDPVERVIQYLNFTLYTKKYFQEMYFLIELALESQLLHLQELKNFFQII